MSKPKVKIILPGHTRGGWYFIRDHVSEESSRGVIRRAGMQGKRPQRLVISIWSRITINHWGVEDADMGGGTNIPLGLKDLEFSLDEFTYVKASDSFNLRSTSGKLRTVELFPWDGNPLNPPWVRKPELFFGSPLVS